MSSLTLKSGRKVLTRSFSEAAKRFWPNVQVGAPDACWPFTAARFYNGYGASYALGPQLCAHRVAYILANKVILTPAELVLHRCNHKPCCNPVHLYAGDQFRNMADAKAAGVLVQGKKLTAAELATIRNYRLKGLNTHEIGQAIARRDDTVGTAIRRLGLPPLKEIRRNLSTPSAQ